MEFKTFIRKPFQVQAVQITSENMEEVAIMIGGRIKVDESTDIPFIQLNRQIIPNVGKAYIGWWVTQLGENFRCYATKVFHEQFDEVTTDQPLTNGQIINNSDAERVDVV